MAGIYLHIPFCRKACIYCDFHFSTQLKYKPKLVDALCREIAWRQDYLGSDRVNSIYFGGGTPSVLTASELQQIFDEIDTHFEISAEAEITLEANPDDLTNEKLREVAESPVNRLSVGIQSFNEEDLKWMNRSHNAQQAATCVQTARDVGFENFSIDLIYALPGRDLKHWQKQLNTALELDVPHISAYALTVEKETILENWIRKGKVPAIDEAEAHQQFLALSETLRSAGYGHYEISNFAKPGYEAVHNSSYWSGEPYLGIGPSAHSFDGDSRQWNVGNNHLYFSALKEGELNFEKENLSQADHFNEFIMTSLRKAEGVDLHMVDQKFGSEFSEYLLDESAPLLKDGRLVKTGRKLTIPLDQRFFSDGIASSLFYI